MNQSVLAGEGEMGNSGVRTVVVGVKLESQSKELLTWALVKVAQPGDLVIALHVLSNNVFIHCFGGVEIVDRDGKSCLLSLVKAFDSVLAVYEGFCNLKQVDLKFKVCRGSSIRKILVQEAKAFFASEVIVGTARKHHKIRSSASVAKYCAKKLPKDCSVLAVDYGKVVFRREASLMTNGYAKGIVDHRHRLLSALQRSLIKNPKILHVENADDSRTASDKGHRQNLELTLVKAEGRGCTEFDFSLLIRELPEPKPGWPLLQRAISSDQLHSKGHSRKISVVQWAMQLPSRHCLSSDSEQSDCKSGAIVPDFMNLYCEHLFDSIFVVTPENLIGKGGSSQVYRGCLPDGKEIANIISLFGFCFEDGNVLLVYDFLSRGSVEENLHGNKDSHTHSGGARDIREMVFWVLGGLVVLREIIVWGVEAVAIWQPMNGVDSRGKRCWGAFPGIWLSEYFMFGKVNDKIDVYAFGVVLLELLSGRKPISNDHPKGQESLVMWAKPILNGGKVAQLLDPSLANDYDCDQMERVALAATLCNIKKCSDPDGKNQVLKLLQGDPEVTKWARLQVNASEETDTPDDEAFPSSNIQSHLNLALLDTHEDSLSMSSIEQTVSLEDYLRGRWSCSSSLD
ncbi:kinase with adenine nucleotide alpha hydrolases-like domain-containing protein [Actinidia rufa]|uniref:Kinase with adenine nucleotide alpha hydrolases-like domain-containing protein n=1 Tax=Actinidia rufa TaxID=165716 RepID=A0A7J0FDQ8_9ERIC|nr:kinase with adenine nucleotide alpha hydrolases-like domain-containing protein [Actinidia rufa]